MTTVERDTATSTAHDPSASPRRRSRAPRSPSVTRSPANSTNTKRAPSVTSNKRSPSPIVAFGAVPLSPENPKGVKNITRKVIKRLEGLGHLEEDDMPATEEEDSFESEDKEIEEALYALGKEAIEQSRAAQVAMVPTTNGHGKHNGHNIPSSPKPKPDYEIPRKVLHSSIGFLTLYLYVSEGDVTKVIMVLWMALAIIVPAELLRFNWRWFARTYEALLGFLMRESERNSINGVVWYILGVNFVLSLYPQDVATVAILILSWADTAASTFGRLYGSLTRKLPARVPILRLPLAPRKSFAGFAAATITGAAIAFGFWGYIAPIRAGGRDITWEWNGGVRQVTPGGPATSLGGGGVVGLLAISVVAGIVSGVAEALDLGSLDDNLTLPIISGGCILGFLKVLGHVASRFFS